MKKKVMCKKKTILITSIGKRVQLINHLKKKFKIVGVDAGDINAGRYFVDEFYKIPKVTESNYVEVLLDICKKESVKGLIPLYEGEFQVLNSAREKFEEQGIFLILSGEEVNSICKDKKLTYEHFMKSKIKLPKVYYDSEINEIIEKEDITKFPLFIKPVDGMGSSNAFRINNINELKFFRGYIKNNIMLGTVFNNYKQQGKYIFDIAYELATNGNVNAISELKNKKSIKVSYTKITADNVDEYMGKNNFK